MQRKQAAVAEIEKKLLLEYLRRAEYNVTQASEKAEMLRSAFQRLLTKHAIDVTTLRREWRAKEAPAPVEQVMP